MSNQRKNQAGFDRPSGVTASWAGLNEGPAPGGGQLPWMRALVTGATGYLGTLLGKRLRAGGVETIAVPGREGETDSARALELFERRVRDALAQSDVQTIFHLAGSGLAALEPEEHHRANVETSRALARAIEGTGFTGTMVFSSSAAVYGNSGPEPVGEEAEPRPCSVLGESKLQAERELTEKLAGRCRLRVARVFNPFGRGHAKLVVYQLARKILTGQGPLQVHGVRDFIPGGQAVDALLWLARPFSVPSDPWVVNVGTGQAMSIENLARRLLALSGQDPEDWELRKPDLHLTADACVADPSRLVALGFPVSPPSDQDFLDTLAWIRETDPALR